MTPSMRGRRRGSGACASGASYEALSVRSHARIAVGAIAALLVAACGCLRDRGVV